MTPSARWSLPPGSAFAELRADGGATANAWLMQFQADILGVPVVLSETSETSALGAAFLAGVGAGLCTISDVAPPAASAGAMSPACPRGALELLAGWADALERTRSER